MITKEKAVKIAEDYLKKNEINYKAINDNVERIESEIIPFGKYEGDEKTTLSVCYSTEGYQYDNLRFISLDAKNGEVLFIMTEHGYLEP